MAAVNGTATVTSFKYITAPEVWGMGIALPVVSTAIVALRFTTRWLQKTSIGADDWLILGGVICFIGIGICFVIGAATHTMGFATPPLPANLTTESEILNYIEPAPELVGKLEFALQLLTVACYGFVKLSILAFYRQIFVVSKRTIFDRIVLIAAWVIFLWTITFIFIIIFPCGVHVDNNWGSAASQIKHCLVIGYTSLDGLAASDFILDLFLICLPLPMIWRLHMKNSRKIAVTGIMMLGATALGASIARLVLYVQTQAAAEALVPVDFDEEITLDMYWSGLECGLAIIAACLPKLSYLFNRFSLRSAVNSVRSAFSINSLRSTNYKSEASHPDLANPYIDIEANSKRSSSSRAQILAKEMPSLSVNDYPMDFLPSPEVHGNCTFRNDLETRNP